MSTRAQELLDEAQRFVDNASNCPHIWPDCVACEIRLEHAQDCARAALLAILRKQHLRLTYFAPDAERRTLREQLRIALDNDA